MPTNFVLYLVNLQIQATDYLCHLACISNGDVVTAPFAFATSEQAGSRTVGTSSAEIKQFHVMG